MKKTMIIFSLIVLLSFHSIVYAADQSLNAATESNITVHYTNKEGHKSEVSILDKVVNTNTSSLIRLKSLDQLSYEANQYLFIWSYVKYSGYVLINIPGNNKIRMWVNKRSFEVVDKEWNLIGEGELKEAPIVYDNEPMFPVEAFNILGYSVQTNKNGGVVVNLTEKAEGTQDTPFVLGVDRSDETIIVRKEGKDVKFRLIGVNLPDDDTVYNTYTADYINDLKGKYVLVKNAVWSEEGFFYAYIYPIGEKVSINEDMVGRGYSFYADYDVEDSWKEIMSINVEFAKSNQLGVYSAASNEAIKAPIKKFNPNGKTFHVAGIEGKIVTLKQNDAIYEVDFGDRNISEVMQRNASLSLLFMKKELIGKQVELLVAPKNNYEFILYLMVYIKDHKRSH